MPVVHDLGGHGFAVLLPANNRVLISHLDFGWRRGRGHVLKLLPGCLGVWDPYVHTSSRCLVVSPAPVPTGPSLPGRQERAQPTDAPPGRRLLPLHGAVASGVRRVVLQPPCHPDRHGEGYTRHKGLLVADVDLLDLLRGHVHDDAIALMAELSPPLDVLNRRKRRELPCCWHPIVGTVFFTDDGTHRGGGRRCLGRDVHRDGREARGCRLLLRLYRWTSGFIRTSGARHCLGLPSVWYRIQLQQN